MFKCTPPPREELKVTIGGGGCDKTKCSFVDDVVVGRVFVNHHPVERMVAF